jgi:hypothetical protein
MAADVDHTVARGQRHGALIDVVGVPIAQQRVLAERGDGTSRLAVDLRERSREIHHPVRDMDGMDEAEQPGLEAEQPSVEIERR